MTLIITPILTIPLINPGDDLAGIILKAAQANGLIWQEGDVLVITQKVVSKAENRFVNLRDVNPSPMALEMAAICRKDARLVEVILSESNEVIRCGLDTLIVEHRLGFICANAGVDHSNVKPVEREGDSWYLKLPTNPDKSAERIREFFQKQVGANIGVLIIDSHGRAWRLGVVGVAIGTSGIPPLVDLRGREDMFGFELCITQVGAVDELAAAASLVMGQADEMIPAVHVRGFPYPFSSDKITKVLRSKDQDYFR